jgi:hypothetical protein
MRSDRGNDSKGNHSVARGHRPAALALAAALALGAGSALAAGGTASGTVAYKGQTLSIKHAYLFKGPDVVEKDKVVRRLILVPQEPGKKLEACKTMSCTQNEMGDGLSVDMDAGPRFGYWVALKGGMVQYSGTARPATLAASTEQPDRLAGKLSIDDSGSGGPKIDVQFDAPLVKELKEAF